MESYKIVPHNLRHLFARTFYSLEKDLSRLADILGHSSVTTRIYTAESNSIHARKSGGQTWWSYNFRSVAFTGLQ